MHEKECVISTNRKTATKRHSQSAARPARSLIFLSCYERRAHQILGFRTDENGKGLTCQILSMCRCWHGKPSTLEGGCCHHCLRRRGECYLFER